MRRTQSPSFRSMMRASARRMPGTIVDAYVESFERPPEERFESLEQLDAAVVRRHQASRLTSIAIPAGGSADPLSLVDGEWWLTAGDRTSYQFNDWSLRQLFQSLDVSPDLRLEAAAKFMNDRLRKSGRETTALVQHADAPWRKIRGFIAEGPRLPDSQLTGFLTRHLPRGWFNPVAMSWENPREPYRPGGLYSSDRDLWAFFVEGGNVLDLGGRDQLHRGFFVWNSEVGERDFGWSSFYFRGVCANHVIWGVEQQQTHEIREQDLESGWKAFADFVASLDYSRDDAGFIEAVREAKSTGVGGAEPGVFQRGPSADKLADLGFSDDEIIQASLMMQLEEPDATGTAWDWLQGFTAVARSVGFVSDRVALERRASAALLRGIAAPATTASRLGSLAGV